MPAAAEAAQAAAAVKTEISEIAETTASAVAAAAAAGASSAMAGKASGADVGEENPEGAAAGEGDGINSGVGEEESRAGNGRAVKEGRWLPTELARFVAHLDESLHKDGRPQRARPRRHAGMAENSCVVRVFITCALLYFVVVVVVRCCCCCSE